MLETDVDSFILRFVQERSAQESNQNSGSPAAPWHGVIRHVQSKEEIRFTQIEDALRFVANYVELGAVEPTRNDTD
jgi:hypothetical protein